MQQLLDSNEALIAYTVLGGFIVIFGLVSLIVKEKLYLSEALVATLLGLLIGPACLNLIDPTQWEYQDAITEELTRIVLAIQVMAAAVNLPRTYVTRHAASMLIMLFPVMIFMWIVSAFIIYIFIPDAGFTETLLIASCITPTDPILANSVVQGSFAEKHIPTQIRHLLSAESGANDGMGFPFLFLSLYLLQAPNNPGSAIGKWIYYVWGYHILFSILLGFLIGWSARKLLHMAENNDWIDKESFLSFSFALAIFTVGFVGILGSDALLACFVAGTSFAWDDWFREEMRDAHLQGVIDLLLNLTTFIYIGTMLPWSSFYKDTLSLRHLVPISVLVLIFRRLPIVVGLKKFIPAIHTFKEALFAGYFGPIGVGAIFLAVTVEKEIEKTLREYPLDDIDEKGLLHTKERVFPIVAFIVLSSVVVHGITVPILNIGSRIDIERFPSIASISSQVARLPVIDFVESLTLERDSQGRIRKREKAKAEVYRTPARTLESSRNEQEIPGAKIEVAEEEKFDTNTEEADHVTTGVLVDFEDGSEGVTQSSSSSSSLLDSDISEGGSNCSNYASRSTYHHATLNNLD
ncbi:8372_t:CDS:10 [Ambispora leptoticha]|uniref:8372_t:CDS:1 n=1 Tax=Ambispora leptoticha TaxID=144679 RepID=A0A9N9DXJ5_9GLOM|nr:8372_t:CDS:10 [Ambispora leptoticha]